MAIDAATCKASDPLEDLVILVQAELTKVVDARLLTIEAKLDKAMASQENYNERLDSAIVAGQEALEKAMESPMLKGLLSGGFAGFPGFGG